MFPAREPGDGEGRARNPSMAPKVTPDFEERKTALATMVIATAFAEIETVPSPSKAKPILETAFQAPGPVAVTLQPLTSRLMLL